MFIYSYKIVFLYTNYVDKPNIILMLLISTYLLAKNELYVKKQHCWQFLLYFFKLNAFFINQIKKDSLNSSYKLRYKRILFIT